MASLNLLKSIMFFQLFIFGSFSPIQSLYFQKYLGLDGATSGFLLGLGMVVSIISPLIATYLVERYKSARRVIQLCHSIGALGLLFFSSSSSVTVQIAAFLLFSFIHGPTVGLINSYSFSQIEQPQKVFGSIRMWGTLGWIIAGYALGILLFVGNKLFSLGLQEDQLLPWAYRIAAVASLLIVFILQFAPSQRHRKNEVPQHESIVETTLPMVRNKPLMQLISIFFVAGFLDRFYTFGAGPYLVSRAVPESFVLPALTFGQILEIPALLLLGRLINRFSMKKVFLAGIALQVVRYALLSFSSGIPFILLAISMNGLVYSLLYTVAIIFMDSLVGKNQRARIHQISHLLNAGIGGLFGSFSAGLVYDFVMNQDFVAQVYWYIPLCGAAILFCMALFFYQPQGGNRNESPIIK